MKSNQKAKGSPKTKKEEEVPETIQERVHRHISDINSTITDDDIRNVRTELEVRADVDAANLAEENERQLNGKTERDEEEVDQQNDEKKNEEE